MFVITVKPHFCPLPFIHKKHEKIGKYGGQKVRFYGMFFFQNLLTKAMY